MRSALGHVRDENVLRVTKSGGVASQALQMQCVTFLFTDEFGMQT